MIKTLTHIKLILAICFFAVFIGAYFSKVIINITPSYPLGFYQMTNEPIAKGTMVIFCLPQGGFTEEAMKRGYIHAGYCPSRTTVMIKKIVAAQNDQVEINDSGVFINGDLLPNSKPALTDSGGRPMPALNVHTILDNHSFLLMSDYSPKSFDGRYLGITDRANIISAIRPLWVW